MKAEIISTGNELLEGKVRERNASFAAARLWQIGLPVDRILVVSDGLESIRQAVAEALLRSDVVIVSGGLGPTEDDRTAEAVAMATGLKLELDARGVGELKKRFEALGLRWTENQARQMRFPQGARPIANPRGTAPGFELEHGGKWIFCLPGPPREFEPMFAGPVLERLRDIVASIGSAAESLVLRAFGVGEGHLQDMLRAAGVEPEGVEMGFRTAGLDIEIILRAAGENAREKLERAREMVVGAAGRYVYSTGDKDLARCVVEGMAKEGKTLAFAESCTGGLAGKLVTDVPGASGVLLASLVTYSNEAKVSILGVPREVIERHGAVSAECVEAMAEGARTRTGADLAISISGIAGPSGGTSQKPVGTVWFGIASTSGVKSRMRRFPDLGRDRIRRLAAAGALWLAWRWLAGNDSCRGEGVR